MFNYSTKGVFAGGSAPYSSSFEAISTIPLEGLQSSRITLNYQRADLPDWAGGGEQTLVARPRADLELSYIFARGLNEQSLGFIFNNGTPALLNMNSERNYYLEIDNDNQDLIGYPGTNTTILGFGNGTMTRYAFDSRVGQPNTVTIGIEALNLLIQTGANNPLPAIFKQSGSAVTGTYTLPPFGKTITNYFEAAPANIVLSFDTGSAIGAVLSGNNFCPLESFGFTIDMPREDVKEMGWAYPNQRPMKWPLTIGIHAEAYLNRLQIDAINRYGCPDSGLNFNVGFNSACNVKDAFLFQFQGAKLDNQTFTADIGSQDKVSLNWSLKIYDINRTGAANFFISGAQTTAYNTVVFPSVASSPGVYPFTLNIGTYAYLSVISGPAIMSGNSVFVADTNDTSVVRVNVSGSSEFQDITINVTNPFYNQLMVPQVTYGSGVSLTPFIFNLGTQSTFSVISGNAYIFDNYVFWTGGTSNAQTSVVRVSPADGSAYQDVTITVA